MEASVFERPLTVGKIDNFTLTLRPQYLEGEVITSATVTTTSANLTINAVVNNGTVISASCTGVTEGDAVLSYDWVTASRSGCRKKTVIILNC